MVSASSGGLLTAPPLQPLPTFLTKMLPHPDPVMKLLQVLYSFCVLEPLLIFFSSAIIFPGWGRGWAWIHYQISWLTRTMVCEAQ